MTKYANNWRRLAEMSGVFLLLILSEILPAGIRIDALAPPRIVKSSAINDGVNIKVSRA
jgi:hypothetical protein